ncbi:MAG: hypothetical protein ACK41T_02675 [Pseudobdellovibrio sp.]
MSIFFVGCQPGLELDLQNEIEHFWHLLIDLDGLPTRTRPEWGRDELGGVEILCENHLGFQINLFSKLANRVLWRIEKFEARYFDQFEKALKKIDLKKHLGEETFNLYIESSKSRLFHEGNLKEAAHHILKKANTIENEDDFSVYIRIHQDQVVMSLDSSGKHLHKRGYRLYQGAAPIRETLAAKMYNFLLQSSDQDNTVGYSSSSPETVLLDPFCGSGTLLFEAASFFIPQVETAFQFEKFKSAPALMKSPTWRKNYKIDVITKNQFLGCELDTETYKKLILNYNEFLRCYPILENTKEHFKFINADSQKVDFGLSSQQKIFFIANPPYGERLKQSNALAVLHSLERLEGLKGGVLVHPHDWVFNFSRLKLKQSTVFDNQGLKLKLSLFVKV